jgi:hypothetical protein
LFTSAGVAATYALLLNTWNTLPETYQQRAYKNMHATVKRQNQQVENPTTAMVISVDAARDDNGIVFHYLASKVVLEEDEIGTTYPNIGIDDNWPDDELHFGWPGCSRHYKDEGDAYDVRHAIPPAIGRQCPTTELERFDTRTRDCNGCEGEDGYDRYKAEEHE